MTATDKTIRVGRWGVVPWHRQHVGPRVVEGWCLPGGRMTPNYDEAHAMAAWINDYTNAHPTFCQRWINGTGSK